MKMNFTTKKQFLQLQSYQNKSFLSPSNFRKSMFKLSKILDEVNRLCDISEQKAQLVDVNNTTIVCNEKKM